MDKCLQCRQNSAKFKEEFNELNVYCSRLCQLEYHLVGLQGFGDDIVGLEASDGETRIRITVEQAKKMKMIDELIENVGTNDYIPLPLVDNSILLLIQFFINNIEKNLNDEEFFNLFIAADYLDYEDLLYYLMPEWINHREFPGYYDELEKYIPMALIFIDDLDRLDDLPIPYEYKEKIQSFTLGNGDLQWAIRLASVYGYTPVVKQLLKDPTVNPAADNNYAIRWSAREGHLEVVNLLLQDKRVDPSAKDDWAFISAAGQGHLSIVRRLLQDKRVDPTTHHNQALRFAADKGRLDVVEELLKDKRVDPSDYNNQAIQWAAENGHLKIVELLLKDDRVDPFANDNEAIKSAKNNNHLDIVELLLKKR